MTLNVRHAFRVLFCLEPSFEMQAMDVGLAERHSLALVGRYLVGVDTFEAVIYLP